jgi:hypothetical protein
LSQKRRKSRGVVYTSVLVVGVAGMKDSVHESNVAGAKFVQRWVEERTFVWPISDEILEEYREVLARLGVRRPLVGKIVNTLRARGERVKLGPTRRLSPDPIDSRADCVSCSQCGGALRSGKEHIQCKNLPAAGVTNEERRPVGGNAAPDAPSSGEEMQVIEGRD